jgi:Sec-independent protein translocase protein TatA
MFGLQPTFLILVLAGALVIFGSAYLPYFRRPLRRPGSHFEDITRDPGSRKFSQRQNKREL